MARNVKPRRHALRVAFVALASLAFVFALLRAPSLETLWCS
jgi:hypothetical protein